MKLDTQSYACSSLKIGFWNVEGIYSRKIPKLTDDNFRSFINEHDIVGLGETQTPKKIEFPGYTSFCKVRKRSKKARKHSGSLAFLVKNDIRKGCHPVQGKSIDAMWLKLDKHFFHIKHDIYICNVYFSPNHSSFSKSLDYCPFDKLEEDMTSFSNLGIVIIGGDFNARTGTKPDFIDHDLDDGIVPLPPSTMDADVTLPIRHNQDREVPNSHGKKLLNFCRSHDMRITNGRTTGDSTGSLTCFKYNGSSAVDYTLVHRTLFDSVLYFRVNDFTPYSDHCMITLCLSLLDLRSVHSTHVHYEGSAGWTNSENDESSVDDPPVKYVWEQDSGTKFLHFLEKSETSSVIDALQNSVEMISDITQDCIDDAVQQLSNVFNTAADECLKKKHGGRVNRKNVQHAKPRQKAKAKKKWFDASCIDLRRNAVKAARSLQKNPFNNQLRSNYFVALKIYKRTVRQKKRHYINSLVDDVLQASAHNPKVFWSTLKKLKSASSSDTDNDETDSISVSSWLNHFKDLNQCPSDESDPSQKQIQNDLLEFEKSFTFNELDYRISHNELSKAINQLKNNKATSFDSISNEMIKHCGSKVKSVILKLFNLIFQSSLYPHSSAKGIISTIYKSGDSSDCNNYRGITISSCLGKVFSFILNQRLLNFTSKHKVIPENQIGFMPNSRTSDHVFVLKCAIDKYLRKKKKLYVCFIDFKKAFDSICHDALFLKLQQNGIGGLFYKIVKSMYLNTKLCVRTSSGLTKGFSSNVGVRQGCSLSPLLFNLFLADLQPWLDNNKDSVQLFSRSLSHLLYADDLVILSESPDGLQSNLNSLEEYCKKWKLSVNPQKSKVMIFSNPSSRRCGIQADSFYFGPTKLEVVTEYKYLGVIFSNNGSFQSAKANLEKKSRRALFGMHSYLSDCSLPPTTSVDLYNKLIEPISSYGSEVWAPFCLNLNGVIKSKCPIFDRFLDFPGSRPFLKFCKRILGVHEKACNLAVLGELGQPPPIIPILVKCINFWLHILQSPEGSFLYDAYLCSYETFFKNGKDKWFQLIKHLSQNYPILKKFWENHRIRNARPTVIKKVLHSFKGQLYCDFKTYWNREISRMADNQGSEGRLTFFRKLKADFRTEEYLNRIKKSKLRSLLTKIRISAHNLAIESGRHKKIPRDQRLCTSCTNATVEDEVHFLLHCDRFAQERIRFFVIMENYIPGFETLPDLSKIDLILNRPDVCISAANYIATIFEKRKTSS